MTIYLREGFEVERIEQGGRHYKVWYRQFPEMQIVTANEGDIRGIRNNLARYRRLASAYQLKGKP